MTDDEFMEELVARVNLFLDADLHKANKVLCTPLPHAGYASVGHFLGMLALPRSFNPGTASPEEVANVKMVMPVIRENTITEFALVAGSDLQKRAQATKERLKNESSEDAEDAPDSKVH